MPDFSRRKFIKNTAISLAGLGLANSFQSGYANTSPSPAVGPSPQFPATAFVPNRAASWWTDIEDIQWPQKKIVDRIKKRAAGFASAKIDTAINFGFHVRFDFADYFGQLHGYYANVCDELHRYGIHFMEHYSCNHVARPKNDEELKLMSRFQRHQVLLFHDAVAARHAQYEGHLFDDICQVDIRDGSRGYAPQYQLDAFCHNNPAFLDMHQKYLQRLIKEVPFDGIMVDDMCNYAGPAVCGCRYCRERFKKDYGREIPAFGDPSFWGDTSKEISSWGNYKNPVFREWVQMKTDCIVDHLRMIKHTIGPKPLMTCCSDTGPIVLNAFSLDLEKMAPCLNFFMLENVGTNVKNINWMNMDAEALHQKDIAEKNNRSPAIALSYTIYEKGAYLGWALSRFWGVSNWSSTLNHRLEEDPVDAMEMEDVITGPNNWEAENNDLLYTNGKDLAEVRLVNNHYCRDNGWRDDDGNEHWDRISAWSRQLVQNNVGYRFLRSAELGDQDALAKEKTPLILDGVGCVSDRQFSALTAYLSKGGVAWISLPFGTHDEKGFVRSRPLSAEILSKKYKNLSVVPSALSSDILKTMMANGTFHPVIKQVAGGLGWAARIRFYDEKPVIHFMNTALLAVAHPTLKDLSGIPVLQDVDSLVKDNNLAYEIDDSWINAIGLSLMSPELKQSKRTISISRAGRNRSLLGINLEGIKLYAVLC